MFVVSAFCLHKISWNICAWKVAVGCCTAHGASHVLRRARSTPGCSNSPQSQCGVARVRNLKPARIYLPYRLFFLIESHMYIYIYICNISKPVITSNIHPFWMLFQVRQHDEDDIWAPYSTLQIWRKHQQDRTCGWLQKQMLSRTDTCNFRDASGVHVFNVKGTGVTDRKTTWYLHCCTQASASCKTAVFEDTTRYWQESRCGSYSIESRTGSTRHSVRDLHCHLKVQSNIFKHTDIHISVIYFLHISAIYFPWKKCFPRVRPSSSIGWAWLIYWANGLSWVTHDISSAISNCQQP